MFLSTKTVGGKRYRYTNGKWQQIKATGNVSPTSSRNRSARSSQSNASVSNDSNRPRRGGVRTTTDTQRTSTGSAKVTGNNKALPPGTKGGALATTKGPRRTNVNSNPPSSGTRTGRGGLPPRLRGVLETRGILPPASTPKGTSKPTDGRRAPTRRENATARARQAAQGSRSSTVRTGLARGGRMGPLSALVEQGASRLLDPLARRAGYALGAAGRRALGGGEPTKDINGNPIKPDNSAAINKRLQKEKEARARASSRSGGNNNSQLLRPAPASKPNNNTNTPKPSPTGSTGSSGSRSGGSGPTRKPQSKDMDANYRAWAKANPKLAAKVKKGQAGYKAINSSKSNQPKNAGAGNGAPGAQSRSTSTARNAVRNGVREGRKTDMSINKKKEDDKKKKKSRANALGWKGNQNY